MSHPSLRRRLVAGLLSVSALVWALTSAGVYFYQRAKLERLFDERLAQAGFVLLTLVHHEFEEAYYDSPRLAPLKALSLEEIVSDLGSELPATSLVFQIRVNQDKFVFRGPGSPKEMLSRQLRGYSNEKADGHAWRVYTIGNDSGQVRIHIGERRYRRNALILSLALEFIYPMIIGMGVLAVLIWLLVSRALSPLNRLALAVEAREPAHLDPLPSNGTPQESLSLVRALNALLKRLSTALENERRFTADAAHELRTPLAALRTQAQVAQRASDAAQRDRALRAIIEGVDRNTHLVEQLLTLARLDHQTDASRQETLDLCAITVDLLVEMAPLADRRHQTIGLDETCGATLAGCATTLRVMLRNLVDNALRYTPPGGQVAVRLSQDVDTVQIEIDDSGPGIPTELYDKVRERFRRVAGGNTVGSGLGLSIVDRIVEQHQGTLNLEQSPLGGLRVVIRLTRKNRLESSSQELKSPA
ncbi:MAG: sensor histidine kinase N-terminal domain-containing protein [Chromatiales bacterium]|nr:sensor histidine kinase N-terminal domain-containing protein [Chromatiales bacterium]